MSPKSEKASDRSSEKPERAVGLKTPDRILLSAGEVFASSGFDGATMDEIAEKAQVEKANIYYYFDGKAALYRALLDKLFGDLEKSTLAIPQGKSLWADVEAFVDVLFDMLGRYQHVVALGLDELLHPHATKRGEKSLGDLLGRLENAAKARFSAAMGRGEITKGDPGQLVVTLEGILLAHFLLPKERLGSLTGAGGKFQKATLLTRKKAVLDQIGLLIGRKT
ncbi:MAG: TetR/AcrR family transcriptional regulator [Deltaproteobacteria bacterium]|nr:TetR/AcrR family transcriptional regulator [Deltaproteobacteria bacterium]